MADVFAIIGLTLSTGAAVLLAWASPSPLALLPDGSVMSGRGLGYTAEENDAHQRKKSARQRYQPLGWVGLAAGFGFQLVAQFV